MGFSPLSKYKGIPGRLLPLGVEVHTRTFAIVI